MPTTSSPQGRREILEAFQKLPQNEKEFIFTMFQQHNCLMVLWGLGELPASHLPPVEGRRQLLLAYKALQWIWFDRLPEGLQESFQIHICERFPKGQGFEDVHQAFAADVEQLTEQCNNMRKPGWVSRRAKRMNISIHSFPYKTHA